MLMRGQPWALVLLKETSMGKFQTTDWSTPAALRAICDRPVSMPSTTVQSGPKLKP